jgi:acetoin utilization deacetylase AcuC-like enzyme
MIGFVYDDIFLAHGVPWHPENPRRLEATLEHLKATGWLDRMTRLPFEAATVGQLSWLHQPFYVEDLQEHCASGGGSYVPDTVATEHTFEAATMAVGGCMAAVVAALKSTGAEDDASPRRSFCLVRPPGHHALAERPMGFCFLNNAALAAERALREGLSRVAIVDFDVHHGNGVQEMFYDRRDVLYISLHESGRYPGTGSLDEVGVEEGAGYTINMPLLPGAMDEHYVGALERVAIPALEEYQPELLLVSAGYDAHHLDHLSYSNLTVRAYHQMTSLLVAAAAKHCEGRMVVVLEGGYHDEALRRGVENTLRAMVGEPALETDDQAPELHPNQRETIEQSLEHVVETHRTRLGLGTG